MSNELKSFIEKARRNKSKREKGVVKDVPEYGELTFIRPREEYILNFMSSLGGTTIRSNEDPKIDSSDIDLEDLKPMGKHSSEFLLHCCPFFRSKELLDIYDVGVPEDLALEVLGFSYCIDLAFELLNDFSDGFKKDRDETKNIIKN